VLASGLGFCLTPQQQQLLQQMLSASVVAVASGSANAGGGTADTAEINGVAGASSRAGMGATPAAAAGAPQAALDVQGIGRKGAGPGCDKSAGLSPEVQQAMQARPPRHPHSSKGVDKKAQQVSQQQQQQGGLSMEILTLLTMIAASAVYGAAESTAAGRPLPASVNPRVLEASKRFLSVLVSMNDPSADDQAVMVLDLGTRGDVVFEAAAAGADVHRDDAAAAAAAAALCALPGSKSFDRSSSGLCGRQGSENEGLFEAAEPLVSRRKRLRTSRDAMAAARGRPYRGTYARSLGRC
jgi:hypothetical protein